MRAKISSTGLPSFLYLGISAETLFLSAFFASISLMSFFLSASSLRISAKSTMQPFLASLSLTSSGFSVISFMSSIFTTSLSALTFSFITPLYTIFSVNASFYRYVQLIYLSVENAAVSAFAETAALKYCVIKSQISAYKSIIGRFMVYLPAFKPKFSRNRQRRSPRNRQKLRRKIRFR